MKAMPDLLDHGGVNWNEITRTHFVVQQEFRYHYPGPVHDLRQSLIVVPNDCHGGQRLIAHQIEVSVPTSRVEMELDRFGNRCYRLEVPRIDQTVSFEVWMEVQREIDAPVGCDRNDLPVYCENTALTEPDAAMRLAAAELGSGRPADLALADRIMHWVYRAMRYSAGVTGVRTTASQALGLGRGVCQDYAHVMLVLCRLCGLPARYVSGHLLGEGGTHAWVEVLVPDAERAGVTVAVAFDPTHDRRAGLTYITVAVGRDYRDVAPTSGSYRAPYAGKLVAMKHAGVVRLEPQVA